MENESRDRANEDDNAEISWKPRSLPPAHYIFKIKNFSLLSKAKADSFQSAHFDVGGYTWKLSVYPRGNKKRNGEGYISLYLVLTKSNKLSFNQEVNVNFKLFVYDFVRDEYLTVHDASEKVRRFRVTKREWGFDKLVSVTDFNDASNGYIADDCCIFGAEILVIENANKGECLTMVEKPANNKYTWTIEKFSKLESLHIKSDSFAIGGSNWRIVVYPKGDSTAENRSFLSVFLELEDDSTYEHGRKLYVEFMLRVRNRLAGKHQEMQGHTQFKSSKKTLGYSDFMPLIDLNDKSKGFISSNTLMVEVEIQAMTVLKELS